MDLRLKAFEGCGFEPETLAEAGISVGTAGRVNAFQVGKAARAKAFQSERLAGGNAFRMERLPERGDFSLKGWQIVAGGRSGAQTTGKEYIFSAPPEGCHFMTGRSLTVHREVPVRLHSAFNSPALKNNLRNLRTFLACIEVGDGYSMIQSAAP